MRQIDRNIPAFNNRWMPYMAPCMVWPSYVLCGQMIDVLIKWNCGPGSALVGSSSTDEIKTKQAWPLLMMEVSYMFPTLPPSLDEFHKSWG